MKILQRVNLKDKKSLEKVGAMIIENALSSEEVNFIRHTIDMEAYSKRTVHAPEIFSKTIFFEKIFISVPIIKELNRIFRNRVALFPSFQLQINSFTQENLTRIGSGLHIDASQEVEHQKPYMQQKAPAWINIGCYLQDHENDGWGGGIAIIPKSHTLIRMLTSIPLVGGKLAKKAVSAFRHFFPDRLLCIVPTKPGDIVIFDSRLLHTSVPGKKSAAVKPTGQGLHQTYLNNIPNQNRKYVFYWFAGSSEFKNEIFRNNFISRADSLPESYYNGGFNYKSVIEQIYPDSYPKALHSIIGHANIEIASKNP